MKRFINWLRKIFGCNKPIPTPVPTPVPPVVTDDCKFDIDVKV